MIDGTPKVQTFEAVTSAFHRIRPEAWHFCYDAYENVDAEAQDSQ